MEIGFEIGDDGEEGGRGFNRTKSRLGGADLHHLFEVAGVVGAHMEMAPGSDGARDEFGEVGVDEATFPMATLGPRIGEIDVEGFEGSGRDHPFQHIGRFESEGADIGQAEPSGFTVDLSQASEQAFHSEEIMFRMQGGMAYQKGSVAGTQFQFHGGAPAEHTGPVEPLQDVGPQDEGILRRRGAFRGGGGRDGFHRGTSPVRGPELKPVWRVWEGMESRDLAGHMEGDRSGGGFRGGRNGGALEDEDVLAGQFASGLYELQRVEGHLTSDLEFGHLVERLDGDPTIFAAILDEDEAAAGLEGIDHGPGHLERVIALVIDIDEEDEVEGVGGEPGIGGEGEDGNDIGDATDGHVGAEDGDHLGLDVGCIDAALGTDALGHAPGEITAAGADIANDHAGAETEGIDEGIGAFLDFAFGTFEPRGAVMGHVVGDLTTEKPFADAIGRTRPVFVEGIGWGNRRRNRLGDEGSGAGGNEEEKELEEGFHGVERQARTKAW